MKQSFAQPAREISAKITIDGVIYTPETIEQFKLTKGLSNSNDWEIGTAFSDMFDATLIDKHGTMQGLDFTGARAKVEIGVKVASSFQYANCGTFNIDSSEEDRGKKIKISGFDDMLKLDKPYVDNMTYPKTLGQILTNVCTQCGLTALSTTFMNSTMSIPEKPQYYEDSCRKVLANIAELACGYARIDEATGKVKIVPIAVDDIPVTSHNTISFVKDKAGVTIDRVIIQQLGTDDVTMGIGDHPYYVTNNVFVQGDAARWIDNLYDALSGLVLTPGVLTFNGNPTESVEKMVNAEYLGETYAFHPLKRELTYKGGLREVWTSPPLANEPKPERRDELVRNILKTNAQIRVMDDAITQRVTKTQILTDPEIRDELKGEPGADGDPGQPGADGISRWTHIRYSANSNGNPLQTTPQTTSKYIGIAVTTSATAPSGYASYTWALFKGADGEDGATGATGADGAQGPAGQDGVDGQDGQPGADGQDGAKGDTGQSVSAVTPQYYKSNSSAALTGGSWGTALPAWEKGKYIWTRLKVDFINPTETKYTTAILDTVNNALNEVYDSGVVLPSQKPQLVIKLAEISQEAQLFANSEAAQGLDEYTAYQTAYTALWTILDGIMQNMSATSEIEGLDPSFQALNEHYSSALRELEEAIEREKYNQLGVLQERVIQALFEVTADSIIQKVSESELFASGDVMERVSALEVSVGGFEARVTQHQEDIGELQSSLGDITGYFTFSTDEENNPYTELGSNINGYRFRQYTDRMSFMDGTTQMAYFSNLTMYVGSVQTNSLGLGPYYEIRTKENNEEVLQYWYHEG